MVLRFALVATLVGVLLVGLLYAYRAQSPAAEQISVGVALTEIQQDKVRAIVIEDDQATLTLTDGTKQLVTTGDKGSQLVRAATDHNQAQPTGRIDLRYANGPTLDVSALMIVVGYLPLIVLVVLIVLAANMMARSRAGRRYELLTRLADLRDRGALTEEEFQREKVRVLR